MMLRVGKLLLMATQKGIEGTVIDGVCRDLPTVRSLGYPIFSKGHYMVTGKDRVEVDYINQPVAISSVVIQPGDLILGDDTGVVCVPQEKAQEVLNIAKNIEEKESNVGDEFLDYSGVITVALKEGIVSSK